jgi:hypothetical protein
MVCIIYHLEEYNLLREISQIYKKNILIKKYATPKIDRTLNSSLIKRKLSYKCPSWKKMLFEMYRNKINLKN